MVMCISTRSLGASLGLNCISISGECYSAPLHIVQTRCCHGPRGALENRKLRTSLGTDASLDRNSLGLPPAACAAAEDPPDKSSKSQSVDVHVHVVSPCVESVRCQTFVGYG
jgi:hypothetical protein